MHKHLLLIGALLLGGCASNQPVIYAGPNGGDRSVSDAAVAECARMANAAGANQYGGPAAEVAKDTVRGAATGAAAGAIGGAIAGNVGQGAGIGAATGAAVNLVQKLFVPAAPNPAYRAYVERCLADKGYQIVGWQ
jgi:outer membrane lipoprotein SlyB